LSTVEDDSIEFFQVNAMRSLDPTVHQAILFDVLEYAQEHDLGVRGLLRSPVLGPKGNVEFLAWLGVGSESADLQGLVEQVLEE
jgi:23S rRNA (cytidine1920-2'-O)/16S rRNA (cytidine1409-2'-O)-methyltransferase